MLLGSADLPCPLPWPGEVVLLAPCSQQRLDLPAELGGRGWTSKAVFAGPGDKSDAAPASGLVTSPSSDSSLEDVSTQGSADLAVVKWARSKNSHKIIHLNISFILLSFITWKAPRFPKISKMLKVVSG